MVTTYFFAVLSTSMLCAGGGSSQNEADQAQAAAAAGAGPQTAEEKQAVYLKHKAQVRTYNCNGLPFVGYTAYSEGLTPMMAAFRCLLCHSVFAKQSTCEGSQLYRFAFWVCKAVRMALYPSMMPVIFSPAWPKKPQLVHKHHTGCCVTAVPTVKQHSCIQAMISATLHFVTTMIS